jgi:hypothetical protein
MINDGNQRWQIRRHENSRSGNVVEREPADFAHTLHEIGWLLTAHSVALLRVIMGSCMAVLGVMAADA